MRCKAKSKAGKLRCRKKSGHKGFHETEPLKDTMVHYTFFWGKK